jgi:molybdopterin-containing oxidoreductase family membrane subunit
MVFTLMLPARRLLKLEGVITQVHLDAMARVMLVAGSFVAYGYLQEHFFAWYADSPFEGHLFYALRSGRWSPLFWVLIFGNVIVPQLLWLRAVRVSPIALFLIALGVNVAMWLERFLIIVPSLADGFLPSTWGSYTPTWVDWSLLSGSIGFFLLCFLVFMRSLPPVPLSEVKHLRRELDRSVAFAQAGTAP